MAAMAEAAAKAGAVAIRAEGADDIRAIRSRVDLPVIGLLKGERNLERPYITTDLAAARVLAEAGADLIAVDATDRPRAGGSVERFLPALEAAFGLPVFADVATIDEGLAAAAAGAAVVATTLAGYTGARPPGEGPDLALLSALCEALDVPVVAEGRFGTPDQVAQAFALGAHAVVVGTAITNPEAIARRFVAAVPP
jgi:putative N-acetylmannosamine-6-phosphate epimerase